MLLELTDEERSAITSLRRHGWLLVLDAHVEDADPVRPDEGTDDFEGRTSIAVLKPKRPDRPTVPGSS